MKEIPLTQGKVTLVDDSDYDELMLYSWYYQMNKKRNYGYAATYTKIAHTKKVLYMQQMIIGSVDKDKKIDHIDRNGLNNQRHNLRIATRNQDAQNRIKRKNSSSRYKGVSYCKRSNKWRVHITVNGTTIDLGYHCNEIAAAELYDLSAKLYFGEFARINFPNQS